MIRINCVQFAIALPTERQIASRLRLNQLLLHHLFDLGLILRKSAHLFYCFVYSLVLSFVVAGVFAVGAENAHLAVEEGTGGILTLPLLLASKLISRDKSSAQN